MQLLHHIRTSWRKIQLVDRFLIIIMFLLVLNSAINIFSQGPGNETTQSVDIVIRTTIASIFGYFISSNFVKNEESLHISAQSIKKQRPLPLTEQSAVSPPIPKASPNNRIQIIIIGILCICSLFIMFGIHYHPNISTNEIASLSQFRDIICGSIGFLIGTPSSTHKN